MTPRPDTGSLAALLAQANPGPWYHEPYSLSPEGGQVTEADARLIALAPDLARLLVDMASWVEEIVAAMETNSERGAPDDAFALLARFAEIERRAAQ